MGTHVDIDEVDVKILHKLVRDSRAKLREIAEECGISSTAVFNRIARLKATGVIIGAVLFIDMNQMGFMHGASMGFDITAHEEENILRLVKRQTNVLVTSNSVGSNTLTIFLVAKSLKDIENLKQFIKKQLGSRKITVNVWNTPQFLFDNIEIVPTKDDT